MMSSARDTLPVRGPAGVRRFTTGLDPKHALRFRSPARRHGAGSFASSVTDAPYNLIDPGGDDLACGSIPRLGELAGVLGWSKIDLAGPYTSRPRPAH